MRKTSCHCMLVHRSVVELEDASPLELVLSPHLNSDAYNLSTCKPLLNSISQTYMPFVLVLFKTMRQALDFCIFIRVRLQKLIVPCCTREWGIAIQLFKIYREKHGPEESRREAFIQSNRRGLLGSTSKHATSKLRHYLELLVPTATPDKSRLLLSIHQHPPPSSRYMRSVWRLKIVATDRPKEGNS